MERYLVKCKYTREFTDGTLKRVSEQYLIQSVNFTMAESRIHKEVGAYQRGEFSVQAISIVNLADIFMYDDSETYFNCRISFVSEDADSGKQKKITNNYLVEAANAREAEQRITECLNGIMVTYDITKIEKTKIVDIFEYEPLNEE